MKRRWIALFLAVVLMASMVPGALAATVENDNAAWSGNVSTPGVNSDPVAQAEMLRQLGLFLGTDKGFELDQPLTRAQAAVMLTRLLGGEEEALAEQPGHPFTDVPQWASPYVGWLYEQGLTKGVGDNLYGAHRDITMEEYGILMARVLQGTGWPLAGYWDNVAAKTELEAWGDQPCLRSMAVGLTMRTLMMPSVVEQGKLLLNCLYEDGLFTSEQLGSAASSVLPSSYETGEDGILTRTVGGVEVARCPETEFEAVEGTTDLGQDWFLAVRRESRGITAARVDSETMELLSSQRISTASCTGLEYLDDPATLGLEENGLYAAELLGQGSDLRYGRVFCWREESVTPVGEAEELLGADARPRDADLPVTPAEGTVLFEPAPYSNAQVGMTRRPDGSLEVFAVDIHSGERGASYVVPPRDLDGDGVAEPLSLTRYDEWTWVGTAGAFWLYGDLRKLTDKPTLQVVFNRLLAADMLTYTPGKTPKLDGQQMGDAIWSYAGSQETPEICSLPADSGHGILVDSVYDYLRFYGTAPNGVRYCYVQFNGLSVQSVAQEGVSEKDQELLLDWERNRLVGLGLTVYPT